MSGWVGEMKGRMRVNPTEKGKYGRPWFVVFRSMLVGQPVCLAHQAGSSRAGAIPAAVLDLTGARPEKCCRWVELG